MFFVKEIADQKIKTIFFNVAQIKIELLEVISVETSIVKFIEKKEEGIHHIAFVGDNAGEILKESEE